MKKLAEHFNALSDETRLRILVLLSRRELCVCELCKVLELPQPNVSQHLGKLKDLGIIEDKKEKKWVFYSLKVDDAFWKALILMIADQARQSETMKKDLERLDDIEKKSELCER